MALKLEKVVKRYGPFRLEVNELTFPERKYTILLGSSGSGKTTTLRIIAGLEIPDSGKIFLDGEDITGLPPWERDVGMVFQNYALYPHLTAYENIAVPLKVKKISDEEIRKKIFEIAEILGIRELLHKYPAQLSGGQQQRVAIARALVKEPKVLLLDEPLSNLDAKLRLELRSFLKNLQRELGMTVIHVTHDQEEAMSIGDFVVLLNDGKIIQVGTPQEIYRRPRNLFVFNFIGQSNVLPASIFGVKDADYVGFRPEDGYLSEGGGDIEGIVTNVQYLGAYKLLEIMITGNHKVKVRVPPGEVVKEGMKISVKVPAQHLLKFKGEELVS
ncbi:MAG: ABC transporter ATP-binding protein [Desulfurococcales archaeon]|nr:ABC transporter ATP-binding protein [Desulfurococcales archaeon]